DIKEYLQRHKVQFTELTNPKGGLEEVLKGITVDVVYMTQLVKEHFADRYDDYEKTLKKYKIGPRALKRMKRPSLVMHPLPRTDELPDEVDSDRRAVYLRQTGYGLQLRMAILCTVLNSYPAF
ncbi:MAG: aspartate carbamoyltransferase, partial [Deltaproteobacteria bacterium]|nr:aspartate carbamoyltransferase [Deltaproteobacteria bacterium]